MALRTPPSWLQNGSHPAENDRLGTQAIISTSGTMGASSLAVSQNSPTGMSVSVAAGWGALVGNFQANMGTYTFYNDGANILPISTANPSNPRIDLVVVTVQDAFYTGASNTVLFQVIAGTPAVSPVVPTLPSMSIPLAQIAVAAGATQITNANITDRRISAQLQDEVVGSSSATAVPLTLQLSAAQSANTLQIRNSAGTIIGWIDNNGAPQGSLFASSGFNSFFLMGA